MTDIAQSPEAVAHQLMSYVIQAEGKSIENTNRDYVLSTYAECLSAVTGNYKSRSDSGILQPKVLDKRPAIGASTGT